MSYSIIKKTNRNAQINSALKPISIAKPIKQYINKDYTISVVREDSIEYNKK
jgi:hypothetical protein